MQDINEYTSIVGQTNIDELYLLADKLKGKSITNINSTAVGGGVAEILTRLIPLLKQLEVDAKWDVIKGDEKFFGITKKFHNALHGIRTDLTHNDLEYFTEISKNNMEDMDLSSDILFIHDPQPIILVEKKKVFNNKWIWRCHIDISHAQKDVIDFLKNYIIDYDASVFSAPAFSMDMDLPQSLISPSIDPLSDKNKDLPDELIDSVLERFGIDKKRPIVTQISRFDRLKDPVGVVQAYKKAKKHVDCQLILAGGGATDDPEGLQVLEETKEAAGDDPDIHIIFLPTGSDIEINALQRASTIILQKSLREGFGLTVSEALWKSKPVIAGAVGGIPLQIKHTYSGILTYSVDGTAHYIKQLISDPEYAKKLGLNGKEHVKNNFLITRHLKEYLLLFLFVLHKGKDVIKLY